MGTIPSAQLTFVDTATAPGAEYFYRIAGVNGVSLEGPQSNEDSAVTTDTAPSDPATFSAVPGYGQVTLNWQANLELDLAGYNLYRSTTDGGPHDLVNVSGLLLTNSHIDSGLTNGETSSTS
jgi:hypothetical protein